MQSSGMYFSGLRLRLKSVASAHGAWWIAGIFLLIQAFVTFAGGHEAQSGFFLNFGLSREGISSGKIWQLLTYGFLHGGFVHAGINAFCVVMMGARVEHILGKSGVIKTMIVGILSGGLAHLAIAPEGVLVGGSGGCVALLILLTTLSPESRMWPLPISARNLGIGVMATELTLALIDPSLGIPGFSKLGEWIDRMGAGSAFAGMAVGHACHFGGGFGGFLLGCWLLRPRVTAESLRRERERREAKKSR